MRLRPTRSLRALAASTALVLCAATSSVGATPRPADAPVVTDSLGVVVGALLGGVTNDEAEQVFGPSDGSLGWVVRDFSGVSVRLLLSESGPWDTRGTVPLLYESEDCSGPALIASPREVSGVRPAIIFDTDVFWAATAGTERAIRAEATLVRSSTDCADTLVGEELCCAKLHAPETRSAGSLTGTPIASLSLSPPFRVDSSR